MPRSRLVGDSSIPMMLLILGIQLAGADLGSTLSEDKSSTAAEVWQEVQKLAKADHAAAKAVVADARAQAGTDVTMGEKAVRLALKKGEAFSREDSKPPKYQLHE